MSVRGKACVWGGCILLLALLQAAEALNVRNLQKRGSPVAASAGIPDFIPQTITETQAARNEILRNIPPEAQEVAVELAKVIRKRDIQNNNAQAVNVKMPNFADTHSKARFINPSHGPTPIRAQAPSAASLIPPVPLPTPSQSPAGVTDASMLAAQSMPPPLVTDAQVKAEADKILSEVNPTLSEKTKVLNDIRRLRQQKLDQQRQQQEQQSNVLAARAAAEILARSMANAEMMEDAEEGGDDYAGGAGGGAAYAAPSDNDDTEQLVDGSEEAFEGSAQVTDIPGDRPVLRPPRF